MNQIPAGLSVPFEVTFDSPSLFVGMLPINMSSGAPVPETLVPMTNLAGTNTYYGMFSPAEGTKYIMEKAVYTSGAYSARDAGYASGTESFYATSVAGGGGGGGSSTPDGVAIVGVLESDELTN